MKQPGSAMERLPVPRGPDAPLDAFSEARVWPVLSELALGPSSPTTSPDTTVKLTAFTAVKFPWCFVSPRASSMSAG